MVGDKENKMKAWWVPNPTECIYIVYNGVQIT